jgi:hypothetical protein
MKSYGASFIPYQFITWYKTVCAPGVKCCVSGRTGLTLMRRVKYQLNLPRSNWSHLTYFKTITTVFYKWFLFLSSDEKYQIPFLMGPGKSCHYTLKANLYLWPCLPFYGNHLAIFPRFVVSGLLLWDFRFLPLGNEIKCSSGGGILCHVIW